MKVVESRRARFRWLALAAGLALSVTGCAGQASDPLTSPTSAASEPGSGVTLSAAPSEGAAAVAATIGLTYVPNIQFAPFYAAETAGLLPEGVTLRHHGQAEGLFTALSAGEEQFVVAGGDEILQARADGVDVVAISAYYRQYPARVIVPEDSSIQTLADLKGHSIGLPGRFGENWFALLLALDAAGLTEADVDIQEIGYTQQVALQTGKVDSTIGFSNGDAVTFNVSGFPVRQIDPQVPLVSICLATTSEFAAAHPETVRAVVAAVTAGIASVVADPEAALDAAVAYIPDFESTRDTSRAVLLATNDLFVDTEGQVTAKLDPAAWQAMAEAMAAASLIPTADGAAAGMTTDFA
ncbi:MAG: ABC transporter substrate-binding protein [Propionibacteriaceae bacterium]|jgi:NitT/TauT family transport system substrate-binding protein|nr:ABC transporter substrate-binding protein [Propionibacteriaceae bacterium]